VAAWYLSHVRPGLYKTALLSVFALGVAASALVIDWGSPASVLGRSAVTEPAAQSATKVATTPECLPSGDGFFRARLAGALETQLDWGNTGTACEGMARPDGKGIRLSFRRAGAGPQELLVVIGIAGASESSSGRALAANVTIIEGEDQASRVFSTLGDDKCTIDALRQELVTPWRAKARTYRASGRGFCIEPASAVGREGKVLMSTFDFAGQVTFESVPPASQLRNPA
jgi:hypothetical protein